MLNLDPATAAGAPDAPIVTFTYATVERIYHGEHTFSFVYATTTQQVVRLYREPMGSGAASKRYNYYAQCHAPADSAFQRGERLTVRIDRKLNPRFDPRRFDWYGDVAKLQGETP